MADYNDIVSFIKSWEGGLSKASTDSASSDAVPDGSGYHTNKGVTWTTWKRFASQLGYSALADSIRAFYLMSDRDWGLIFKSGYWDVMKGDQFNFQGLADSLADWCWLAGPVTAIVNLQRFCKVNVSGTVDDATLLFVNSIKDREGFLSSFSDYKKNWFLSLPNQSANYKGWAARQDALKSRLVGFGSLALLFLLVLGYFLLR